MTRWKDFAADQPDFAQRVQQLFKRQKHMTLATLRRDGSPRISGTEVEFDPEDLVLGMMPGSLKARDLLRDARLALHSPSVEPPPEDESAWPGEAKIAGRAVEITDKDPSDASHRFRVDITEVVLTKVAPSRDHLVIESWHPDRGLQTRQRA
jgi:pyridoxamine 5'-phosphate oxidase-like protein